MTLDGIGEHDPTLAELVADLDATSGRLGLALALESDAWDNLTEARAATAEAIEQWTNAQYRYQTLRANARTP
jgi:hypothetical protein